MLNRNRGYGSARITIILLAVLLSLQHAVQGDEGSLQWAAGTAGYVHSTPAVGPDGVIYVGSYDNKLYALNPDGTQIWTYETAGDLHSSPAIASDGTVYVGSRDNYLYAVNPDGTLKWRFETGGGVDSSPALGLNGIIYVGSNDAHLYALNPDGTERWRFQTVFAEAVQSSPAIGTDGTIYFGADETHLYALDPQGAEKWRFKTRSMVRSTPAIGADGTLYVGSYDNTLYAVNPDGTEKWKFDTGGPVHASPAVHPDGTIYAGSFDTYVYALDPEGVQKWRFKTSDGIFSSPVIGSEDMIYIGSNDHRFYALNPDGSGKWYFETGGPLRSSPAIGQFGTVYIGSRDMQLYAIETAWVPDTIPPMIRYTVPADGEVDVAVTTTVTAVFSEAVNMATLTADTFTVTDDQAPVTGTITGTDASVMFTPALPLDANTAYTATLTTGITDLSGNSLLDDYVFSFTTLNDLCPDDPDKSDPGDCGCGIAETDSDDDQVPDCVDTFPDDPEEWVDTDLDGIGNNGDLDDDGDGMPDTWEEAFGLDPLADDASGDPDGDGVSNLSEHLNGTDPTRPPDAGIFLNTGWNLISLFWLPSETDLETVLQPVAGKYDSVWAYTDTGWKTFDISSPEFSDLHTLEPGNGYWIYMTETGFLDTRTGEPPDTVTLREGWNLVGFNRTQPLPALDAVSSIQGSVTSVWAFTPSGWRAYDPVNPGFSDLAEMSPGKGYWINAHEAGTWTLP